MGYLVKMQDRHEQVGALLARVERLELSNRRLKRGLLCIAALIVGCGAASTTANFKKVSSHQLSVFAAGEKGEVISMSRSAEGGKLVLRDAAGATRVVIDTTGVVVQGADGQPLWQSKSAK